MIKDYSKINKIVLVCQQESNSFANIGLQGWLAAVCKCVVMWLGVSFVFARGEKKQNKFPSNCTAYPLSTNPINPFYVIISFLLYHINVSWFGFLHLHTTYV